MIHQSRHQRRCSLLESPRRLSRTRRRLIVRLQLGALYGGQCSILHHRYRGMCGGRLVGRLEGIEWLRGSGGAGEGPLAVLERRWLHICTSSPDPA
jgi:hypothetical protein